MTKQTYSFSEEDILKIFQRLSRSEVWLKVRDIQDNLRISDEEKGKIEVLLKRMARKEILVQNRDKFMLGEPFRVGQKWVVVKISDEGEILASLAETKDEKAAQEVYRVMVPSHALGASLYPGVYFKGKMGKGPKRVEFLEIVQHQKKTFQAVGVVEKEFRKETLMIRSLSDRRDELPIPPALGRKLAEGDILAYTYRDGKLKYLKIGQAQAPKTFSQIAFYEEGLPKDFPEAVLAAVQNLPPLGMAHRQDLRHLDLLTIDGEDARDFDDAVYAEPQEGGWRVVIAIADVAFYVPPGSSLDDEAFQRGNSVYFPDYAVPMLPEALSNGACSLVPDEDRGCIVADLVIDEAGQILHKTFYRGLMRSKARLTYTETQRILEEKEHSHPMYDNLQNLYKVYQILSLAQHRRGALALDVQEKKIVFKDEGGDLDVILSENLTSHKMIESLMILANVAVAVFLEEQGQSFLYRVHDAPSSKKMRDFEKRIRPYSGKRVTKERKFFSNLLEDFQGLPTLSVIQELILSSQSQAIYSPCNLGHFGLALRRYAHFTSPIRRYADLVNHRVLLVALGIEEAFTMGDLKQVGDHLSQRERAAMKAERNTVDRLAAFYLTRHQEKVWEGEIVGFHKRGIFVRMRPFQIDGFLPLRELGYDRYIFDEKRHMVVGHRSDKVFALGDTLEVEIIRVDSLSKRIDLRLMTHTPQSSAQGHTTEKRPFSPRKPNDRGRRNREKKPYGRPIPGGDKEGTTEKRGYTPRKPNDRGPNTGRKPYGKPKTGEGSKEGKPRKTPSSFGKRKFSKGPDKGRA